MEIRAGISNMKKEMIKRNNWEILVISNIIAETESTMYGIE